jgi:hypothetical protein
MPWWAWLAIIAGGFGAATASAMNKHDTMFAPLGTIVVRKLRRGEANRELSLRTQFGWELIGQSGSPTGKVVMTFKRVRMLAPPR